MNKNISFKIIYSLRIFAPLRAIKLCAFKRKIYLLTSIFYLLSSFSHSQNTKNYIKAGDEFFSQGDFYSAGLNYKKALEEDSSIIDLIYKYAETCRLNLDFVPAERAYGSVFEIDKGLTYKDCSFWLATMKKGNGKYKEAQKLFEKYYKKYKKKNTYFTKKAQQEAAACEYAQLLMSNKQAITIFHLDSSVNTFNAEFAPFEKNETNNIPELYFSSLRENIKTEKNGTHSKIYKSFIINDTIQHAMVLDTTFNKEDQHSANGSFSKDFRRFYYTRCYNIGPTETRCDIFVQELNNGIWQVAIRLQDNINLSGYTNTQPCIGYNDSIGEILFFVSDRPDGEGKMDIWASDISAKGEYGIPYNLGSEINSIDNEVTPFYCNRCKALYFSSDWHKGLGGFDIFVSHRNGKDFSTPENLGFPINSSYNDLYFSINSKGTKAYFSSNRTGSLFIKNETCCNDIYSFKLAGGDSIEKSVIVDSSKIILSKLKLLLPLTLYFHNDEPDSKTTDTLTQKNYKRTYEDYISLNEKYKTEYSKGLRGEERERAKNDIETFFEDSVSASMLDLEKFAGLLPGLLHEGKQIKITMKGYCSPLASTKYNVHLAKRRISSLQNYFMEFDGGILKKYVNNSQNLGGRLEFFNEDIGELLARPTVSDNPNDTKNSIYSRSAALERKIQIIAVSTY